MLFLLISVYTTNHFNNIENILPRNNEQTKCVNYISNIIALFDEKITTYQLSSVSSYLSNESNADLDDTIVEEVSLQIANDLYTSLSNTQLYSFTKFKFAHSIYNVKSNDKLIKWISIFLTKLEALYEDEIRELRKKIREEQENIVYNWIDFFKHLILFSYNFKTKDFNEQEKHLRNSEIKQLKIKTLLFLLNLYQKRSLSEYKQRIEYYTINKQYYDVKILDNDLVNNKKINTVEGNLIPCIIVRNFKNFGFALIPENNFKKFEKLIDHDKANEDPIFKGNEKDQKILKLDKHEVLGVTLKNTILLNERSANNMRVTEDKSSHYFGSENDDLMSNNLESKNLKELLYFTYLNILVVS